MVAAAAPPGNEVAAAAICRWHQQSMEIIQVSKDIIKSFHGNHLSFYGDFAKHGNF